MVFTAQIARALDFKPSNDGAFWMEWKDFSQYFKCLVSDLSQLFGVGSLQGSGKQAMCVVQPSHKCPVGA